MGSILTQDGHQKEGASQIPVVDFSPWIHNPDQASRLKVAKEIVEASKGLGFVYITNHSVSDSLLDEAFEWSRRFFALSTEDKLRAPHPEGWAIHRGYSWPGLEKVSDGLSEGDDAERIKKLREIADFKVCVARSLYNAFSGLS
jgi:isopenicillin N synthase-like dioxygenase